MSGLKKALELIFVIIPFILIAVAIGYVEREHQDLLKKIRKE
jgi:hypothetical protein